MAPTIHVADIIVVAFLLLAALTGFISGFTRLFLGIFSWAASIWLALKGTQYFAPIVQQYVHNVLEAQIIAGSVTFITCLSLLLYVSRSVGSAIKGSCVGGIDRAIGVVFSIALSGVFFSGIFNFAPRFLMPEKYNDLLTRSKLAPYLQQGADLTRQLCIDLFGTTFKESAEPEVPNEPLSAPSTEVSDQFSGPSASPTGEESLQPPPPEEVLSPSPALPPQAIPVGPEKILGQEDQGQNAQKHPPTAPEAATSTRSAGAAQPEND